LPKLTTPAFTAISGTPSVITFLALFHIFSCTTYRHCPNGLSLAKAILSAPALLHLSRKIGPHGQVIISTSFRLDMSTSHIRRQVNLGCPHQAHGHADKATGYPEVGMLTGSLAATVIVLQIFGTITANMECRLHHEVFENMVASFADVARYRRPLTAAGCLTLGTMPA
jgi:hypothetical protein